MATRARTRRARRSKRARSKRMRSKRTRSKPRLGLFGAPRSQGFVMIQHNIGRRQNYNNGIVHALAKEPAFRRTVPNYLRAQQRAGRALADVYTLQEASLPENISTDHHFIDYTYYSRAADAVYMWFRPFNESIDTFCLLSRPFTVGSRNYQYVYVNTANGLNYATSREAEPTQHYHGVAVVYDCERFAINRTAGASVYNVLIDALAELPVARSERRVVPLRRVANAPALQVPRARHSPVVVLRDGSATRGFASYHGKIVHFRDGKGYLAPDEVASEMQYHHNPTRLEQLLTAAHPVYMGADLNLDMCSPDEYFERYNAKQKGARGRAAAKDAFLRFIERYHQTLAGGNIRLLPNAGCKRQFTNVSNDNVRSLIDYIVYRDVRVQKIAVYRDEGYFEGGETLDETTMRSVLTADFDHCPVIMRYNRD